MHNRLSDYDVSTKYQAKVVESERITPEEAEAEVRHLVLEVADPSFDFVEGQNIGVLAPGRKDLGSEVQFRLYSIANARDDAPGGAKQLEIAVRRCFSMDEFSGEREPGLVSNYLCDRKPGDEITITGPYGGAFALPNDEHINLLMIGMGTGIAPFRAFLKSIYKQHRQWKGKIRLFYGAKRGIDMLYMNDLKNDFANYYDEETFKAIEALSPRPAFDEPVALDKAIEEHGKEVWAMIQDPLTNVYVAGLEPAREALDAAMANIVGSAEVWRRTKEDLKSKGRWFELIY